jgi:hypothetical protein
LKRVRIGRLELGIWGLSVFDGEIKGGTIDIGEGNNSFHADSTGIWSGDVDKDKAPSA